MGKKWSGKLFRRLQLHSRCTSSLLSRQLQLHSRCTSSLWSRQLQLHSRCTSSLLSRHGQLHSRCTSSPSMKHLQLHSRCISRQPMRRLLPPRTVVDSSRRLPPPRTVVDSSRRLPSSRSLPLFSSSQPEVHHAKQRSFLEASTNFEFICEPQHTSSHHFDLFRGHGDFDVASLSWPIRSVFQPLT